MDVDTKNIRNVVLLGHSGSGKTTFAETMLFESGAIKRRGSIDEKNTISDFTRIERERGNSIFSTLMHVQWKDSKINLIDSPGFDDFVGEVISSMKVTDTSVMLLNSVNGVEVGTELIWEYVDRFSSPCILVINQIDHEKSDFEKTLQQARNRFGHNVVPVQYPLNQGPDFNTIVDTLRMTMYVFGEEGGKPEKVPIPDSEINRAQEMHNTLVEVAAENDEELMERFFDHGSLNEEELAQGLQIALSKQEFFPVFSCSGLRNMGSGRVMGFINDIAPSPLDRNPAPLENGEELYCNPTDDTTIFIYKTMSEPQVGNVSYFKAYSGSLNSGDELINQENSTSERFNQLYVSNGKNREQTNRIIAGDIGVTVKLKNSHTNNTLNTKGVDRAIEPIDFPPPRIRTAVRPPNKSDVDKLSKALHTIQEEDPTLIVEHSQELNQTILHGQGQLHLDLVKYRVEKVYGLKMEFDKPRIPYRETITKSADESYRHKKQTGGAGQFAEIHIRIEPWQEGLSDPAGLSVRKKDIVDLPWGGQLAFYWCIVGGAIDTKFTGAIKKGIMSKMQEGPLTGSPCRDIRVSVYDGKMHPVDSNDMAFQIAATMAFRNAFKKAAPKIMEPLDEIEVLCSGEVMGDVMSDLQSRRAMILGMDTEGHYQKIKAKVPVAELYRYSSSLRSLSQGRAKFSRSFSEYVEAPHDIQQKLEEEHEQMLQEAGG